MKTKRKLTAIALTVAMTCSGVVANAAHMSASQLEYGTEWANYTSVSASNFKDVRGHWAEEWIDRAYAKELIKGYPDNTFRPNMPITRGEAVTIFANFLGITPSEPATKYYTYSNPMDNGWMIKYIEPAKKLLPQYLDGPRTPVLEGQPITREDVIYALVVALKYEDRVPSADQSVLNMFIDKNSISANLKPYVAVAVSRELVSGYDDNTIGGTDPLTRAEFATLLGKASLSGFGTGRGMDGIPDIY